MKLISMLLALLIAAIQPAFSQAPVIGSYPTSTVSTAGSNTVIYPSIAPSNVTSIIASTSATFQGMLTVNPATGALFVTNASPAGTYIITLTAGNNTATVTGTFTLMVGNTLCSQGLFSNAANVSASNAKLVMIGDFNKDGHQDIAAPNYSGASISIRLGNGAGSFSGTTNVSVPSGPSGLAIADFNGDGNQDLAVASDYNSIISLRFGNGAGGFTGTGNLTVSSAPYAVVAADFNGDGKQDLAFGNSGANSVSIRLGDGAGNFTGTTEISVFSRIVGLTLGDFNNDGKIDFITSNSYGGGSFIRLGDGNGGFSGTGSVNIGGSSDKITVADINKDGNQDIICAISNGSFVSIRYGDGTGNLTGTTSTPIGSIPHSLTVADFNGDGNLDFAVANENQAFVNIRLGDGAGNFRTGIDISTTSSQYGLVAGDFNEDGTQDLILGLYYSSGLFVRLGTPGLAEINVQGNNTNILDGDVTPSLVKHTDFGNVTGYLTRTFVIQNTGTTGLPVRSINLTGSDTASFKISGINLPLIIPGGSIATFPISFYPTATGTKTATVNIYNDDCDEGLYNFNIQGTGVVAPPMLGTYSNKTIKTAANATVLSNITPSAFVQLTATASTGFKGVLSVNPSTGAVIVTNAHPAGNYLITVRAFNAFATVTNTFNLTVTPPFCSSAMLTATSNITVGTSPRSIGLGDFNGDGIQDLATSVSSDYNNYIAISLGNGNGGFVSGPNIVTGGYTAIYLAVGEFNGDGKQDLAVLNNSATSSNGNLVTLLGNGTGGFTVGSSVPVGVGPTYITLGDFNNDGRQDAAVTNYNGNTVSIRLGNGNGSFSGTTEIATGYYPRCIGIADFNNDGKQDIAICNAGQNYISIRMGDGLGNFSGTLELTVGVQPMSIAFGDLNRDGKADFVCSCINGNTSGSVVCVRLGNGLGGFTGSNNVLVGGFAQSIILSDLNGDGKPDFITGNAGNDIYALNQVTYGLGDGGGGFSLMTTTTGTGPYELVAGDFNGDGRQDFATANTNVATVSIKLGTDKEINVTGNNVNIPNNDTTPNFADSTDLGNITFTGDTITRKYSIQNTGMSNLTIYEMELTGADSASFRISGIILPAIIPAGSSLNFSVSFSATSIGKKTAWVNIYNNDCDESTYRFALQAGIGGAALNFDGTDDYITVNNSNAGNVGSSDFTISAWIKTDQTSPGTLLNKGNRCAMQGGGFTHFVTADGHQAISLYDSTGMSQVIVGKAIVNNNIWHQLTALRSGSSISLYLDGVLDTTVTTTTLIRIGNSLPLLIGKSSCISSADYFRGNLDEVRLWNKAISICEVRNSFNCQLSSAVPNLQLYYQFNQGRALENNNPEVTVIDSSGNNFTGSLINFALTDSLSNWINPGAIVAAGQCNTGSSVWLGITSSWNDAANWSSNLVPLNCTPVIISAGVLNMPEITGTQNACFSLKLNSGATITVKNGSTLTITNNR